MSHLKDLGLSRPGIEARSSACEATTEPTEPAHLLILIAFVNKEWLTSSNTGLLDSNNDYSNYFNKSCPSLFDVRHWFMNYILLFWFAFYMFISLVKYHTYIVCKLLRLFSQLSSVSFNFLLHFTSVRFCIH